MNKDQRRAVSDYARAVAMFPGFKAVSETAAKDEEKKAAENTRVKFGRTILVPHKVAQKIINYSTGSKYIGQGINNGKYHSRPAKRSFQ